jgi:hypothetical protein
MDDKAWVASNAIVSPGRNTGTVPALEQQFMTPVSTLRSAVYFHSAADRTFLLPTYLEPQRSQCENACDLFLSLFMRRIGIEMTYSIFARDGTSRIVLKRQSREAAEKKARELTELGWFDVQIAEEVEIEEAECSGK